MTGANWSGGGCRDLELQRGRPMRCAGWILLVSRRLDRVMLGSTLEMYFLLNCLWKSLDSG